MPLYEYRCTACNEHFSRTETMSEHAGRRGRAHTRCPKCESQAVEPVFSPFFAKTVRKS